MKILLIGPYPPPHGGISVHVRGLQERYLAAGVACDVFDPGRARGWAKILLIREIFLRARRGWKVHLHTNGHNRTSWLLALLCALAGRSGSGCTLTFHSGMLPDFLRSASAADRTLARIACRLAARIVCVSDAIRAAVVRLPVPVAKTNLSPAFLDARLSSLSLDPALAAWLENHRPVLSTVLFFRPEYGFMDLITALRALRYEYPAIGCVVMGDSQRCRAAEDEILRAGLPGSILLTGDLEHDVCLRIMSRSDVFVRPTRADGDSISVREAIGVGVPVVASRAGTRPEGTMLFPPGNVDAMIGQLRRAIAISESRETHYASA